MNRMALMALIKAPIISEKSNLAAERDRRIVFKVEKKATKAEIKMAVELAFEVEVESVQMLNVKGKHKRFGRISGKRADWKKAYVKLKPGHDIDFTPA